MKRYNLIGQQFGRLTVLADAGNSKTHSKWLCVCQCGNRPVVRGDTLTTGNGISCGCLARELSAQRGKVLLTKHGHSVDGQLSKELSAYYGARARCRNPRATGYRHYGGRGIQFRFNSFKEFYAELGPRPAGMTLDRINNNGHYEIGNVRWATYFQQVHNRHR